MLLKSDIISAIIQDLRGELGDVIPGENRLNKLFDEVQIQLSVDLECISCQYNAVVPAYAEISDSDITHTSAISGVTGTIQTGLEENTSYAGYTIKNLTTLAEAKIQNATDTGFPEVVLYFDRNFVAATTDDLLITRESRYVDLPWYIIRPYLEDGVIWNDRPLKAIGMPRQNIYQQSANGGSPVSGPPDSYAIEMIGGGVCRIHLYPRPSEAGVLRVLGPRRAATSFFGATTGAGDTDGYSLVCSTLPKKPDNYYVGTEVYLFTGTYAGQVRTITEYINADNELRFNLPFGGTVASGVSFEIASLLPDEHGIAISHFLRWQLMSRVPKLANLANTERELWEDDRDRLRVISKRQISANVHLSQSRSMNRGDSYRINVTE